MTDLVTRLREPHFMSDAQHRATLDGVLDTVKLMRAERLEAAAEITRLTSLLDEAREALKRVKPLFPIEVNNTPDYAELTFGEHSTQAMTVDPATWLALNDLFATLTKLEQQ